VATTPPRPAVEDRALHGRELPRERRQPGLLDVQAIVRRDDALVALMRGQLRLRALEVAAHGGEAFVEEGRVLAGRLDPGGDRDVRVRGREGIGDPRGLGGVGRGAADPDDVALARAPHVEPLLQARHQPAAQVLGRAGLLAPKLEPARRLVEPERVHHRSCDPLPLEDLDLRGDQALHRLLGHRRAQHRVRRAQVDDHLGDRRVLLRHEQAHQERRAAEHGDSDRRHDAARPADPKQLTRGHR
jgi:hypothetical protein